MRNLLELLGLGGDEQPSTQVPTPTAAYPSPTSTCLSSTSRGPPGPTAGGVSASRLDSETGLTIITATREGGEPMWRTGVEIGRATEFVNFNGYLVMKEVAIYVKIMIDAAAEEGTILAVTSGFRTWKKQQDLYKIYLAGGNLAAKAGNSNHQNGIAVDFDAHTGDNYEWMVKNAWKYGFIRSTPRERWHWEYWGDWKIDGVVQKPVWAESVRFGSGGHQPKSIFSRVPRTHTCGVPSTGGGKSGIRDANRWNMRRETRHFAQNHSDGITNGMNNSWIGSSDEHLPDKFDRLYPGWKEHK